MHHQMPLMPHMVAPGLATIVPSGGTAGVGAATAAGTGPARQRGSARAAAGSTGAAAGGAAKRGTGAAGAAPRTRVKKTPEQQRADRRERNRRHARCRRARKTLLIDTLQSCIKSLQAENGTMKEHITSRFGDDGLTSLMASHGNVVDSQSKDERFDLLAPQGAASSGGVRKVDRFAALVGV